MKKASLLLILICFLISGCTIAYSTNIDNTTETESDSAGSPNEGNNSGDNSGNSSEGNNDSGGVPGSSNNNSDSSDSEVTVDISSILNDPDINSRIAIPQNALFYPNTLTANSEIIKKYSYIYDQKASKYRIYSAYYSQYYDTLYIAYDYVGSGAKQTIKAKDLYEIERHALNYFITENNKSDYKNYLKAVLIYPDTLASSCREGKTDNDSLRTLGCASYFGLEATININWLSSMEHFYNKQQIPLNGLNYIEPEGMRYTFAHEFGHVSTYYNMVYKSDEDYEDYLKLRTGSLYNTIYPNGLPELYSDSADSYYTQPEEILADDYVELFYDTSKKVTEDTYDYVLNQEYDRNSLQNYPSIHNLSENIELYNKIKNYYVKNFLDNSLKTNYSTPKVISSSTKAINYYPSYSKIGNTSLLNSILSSIDVNLIAIGEVTVNGISYYRVILSNTFYAPTLRINHKDIGKKIGYVKKDDYTINTAIKIYEINRNNSEAMEKNSLAPIHNTSNIYILPYYDFSYVLNLSSNSNYATMYDYFNTNISNQTYQININSFGTLLN